MSVRVPFPIAHSDSPKFILLRLLYAKVSRYLLHFIKFTHRKLTSPNLSNANFSISGPLYSRNDNVADVEDEEDIDGDLLPLPTPQPFLQSRTAATVLFPPLNGAMSHSNLEETEGNILNKKW